MESALPGARGKKPQIMEERVQVAIPMAIGVLAKAGYTFRETLCRKVSIL
jgi:hypothetical protein